VSSGARVLKVSAVENIIGGILELLPGKDGTLLKPLLEDLPKALRSLLEYQPHVERLSKDCWDAVVDFCLESLSGFFAESDLDRHHSWSTEASFRRRSQSRTPFDSTDITSSRVASSREQPLKKPIPEAFVHSADNFVHCLQLLTKASNAPILDRSQQISETLIQILQRRSGRSQAAALATINSVLARTTLHSLQLTKNTIQDLLPLMKSLWSEPPLRDEILIALMHTEEHVSSILADEHADATVFDIESLVETMYGDYRRRQESTVLQFLEDDYLSFRHTGCAQAGKHPLSTHAFSLESDHVRCESLWATVSAMARLSFMLDHRKRVIPSHRENEEQSAVKRLRITHHFRDYLRHVSEPKSSAKRAALQIVAFMLQEGALDEEDLQSTLEKLTVYISDENPVHSSWAMIALTA
jgi:ataxia telangiectasia mutated family protein